MKDRITKFLTQLPNMIFAGHIPDWALMILGLMLVLNIFLRLSHWIIKEIAEIRRTWVLEYRAEKPSDDNDHKNSMDESRSQQVIPVKPKKRCDSALVQLTLELGDPDKESCGGGK